MILGRWVDLSFLTVLVVLAAPTLSWAQGSAAAAADVVQDVVDSPVATPDTIVEIDTDQPVDPDAPFLVSEEDEDMSCEQKRYIYFDNSERHYIYCLLDRYVQHYNELHGVGQDSEEVYINLSEEEVEFLRTMSFFGDTESQQRLETAAFLGGIRNEQDADFIVEEISLVGNNRDYNGVVNALAGIYLTDWKTREAVYPLFERIEAEVRADNLERTGPVRWDAIRRGAYWGMIILPAVTGLARMGMYAVKRANTHYRLWQRDVSLFKARIQAGLGADSPADIARIRGVPRPIGPVRRLLITAAEHAVFSRAFRDLVRGGTAAAEDAVTEATRTRAFQELAGRRSLLRRVAAVPFDGMRQFITNPRAWARNAGLMAATGVIGGGVGAAASAWRSHGPSFLFGNGIKESALEKLETAMVLVLYQLTDQSQKLRDDLRGYVVGLEERLQRYYTDLTLSFGPNEAVQETFDEVSARVREVRDEFDDVRETMDEIRNQMPHLQEKVIEHFPRADLANFVDNIGRWGFVENPEDWEHIDVNDIPTVSIGTISHYVSEVERVLQRHEAILDDIEAEVYRRFPPEPEDEDADSDAAGTDTDAQADASDENTTGVPAAASGDPTDALTAGADPGEDEDALDVEPPVSKDVPPGYLVRLSYQIDGTVLADGSGFFISSDGYFLTTYHGLEACLGPALVPTYSQEINCSSDFLRGNYWLHHEDNTYGFSVVSHLDVIRSRGDGSTGILDTLQNTDFVVAKAHLPDGVRVPYVRLPRGLEVPTSTSRSFAPTDLIPPRRGYVMGYVGEEYKLRDGFMITSAPGFGYVVRPVEEGYYEEGVLESAGIEIENVDGILGHAGMSGGPVVDQAGKLLGLVVSGNREARTATFLSIENVLSHLFTTEEVEDPLLTLRSGRTRYHLKKRP